MKYLINYIINYVRYIIQEIRYVPEDIRQWRIARKKDRELQRKIDAIRKRYNC